MKSHVVSALALALLASSGLAADDYQPPAGFVPDATTARLIAEAVLIPIYGKEQINSEEPLIVELQGNTWKISGQLPHNSDGGVVELSIDPHDARISHLHHGK